jgi:hypothetical protein
MNTFSDDSAENPSPVLSPSTEEVIPAMPAPDALKHFREFSLLDQRIIRLWQLTGLVFFGLLLLVYLIGIGVCWWKNLPGILPAFVGWLLLAALSVWYLLQYPARAWRAWSYRLDDRVLETRSGVWFQVTRLLPLNRLQHVDLERGPFERVFGLASLVLHTAGTHSDSITIPGLEADTATKLRDHLVELGSQNAG